MNRQALEVLSDVLKSERSPLCRVDLEMNTLDASDVIVLQSALAPVCSCSCSCSCSFVPFSLLICVATNDYVVFAVYSPIQKWSSSSWTTPFPQVL
jgi:hypothetical protein